MNIFISGGCKNGKSSFAQELALKLADGGRHFYVATMIPYDSEDRLRVKRHLENRAGMGFETIECPRELLRVFDTAPENASFLVDSVTALLLNEMFSSDYNGSADPTAAARCIRDLSAFAARAENAVFVSDFIYSDARRYDAFTESYRRALAETDRALAAVCDTVIELCAGTVSLWKGELPT